MCAAQVIHRDLKPGNILIETAGVAKISDFGASMSTTTSFDKKKQGSCVQGTPNYIAPEVLRARKPEDFSYNVDIWSLGMTVIEMFTAKMPFKDDFSNAQAVSAPHIASTDCDLSPLNPKPTLNFQPSTRDPLPTRCPLLHILLAAAACTAHQIW